MNEKTQNRTPAKTSSKVSKLRTKTSTINLSGNERHACWRYDRSARERAREQSRENGIAVRAGERSTQLTEKERAEARSGALPRIVEIVVDDCNGVDGAAEVGLRANLTVIREVVPKMNIVKDARVVQVDPGLRVLLDDVLAGRDDVQLEPLRVLAEHVCGALYDGDAVPRAALEEVGRGEEHPHLAVRLLPSPTPHLMKVIAFEILRHQRRAVGAVVEGA